VNARGAFLATVLLSLAAPAGAAVPAVPAFENVPCSTFAVTQSARCGYLVVAENHAANDGKTVRLAVAILRAASKTPAATPLVYLDGGPGGASLLSPGLWVKDGFNAGRDLVLVDQRGTYYSQPALTCPVRPHAPHIGGEGNIITTNAVFPGCYRDEGWFGLNAVETTGPGKNAFPARTPDKRVPKPALSAIAAVWASE